MVQRKVPNKKLGIPSDDLKFEKQKRLGNVKKPSSCHQLDGKSRGPDLKEKMKKSRSMKLSDIEGLRSSPLNKTTAQPGKPPPLHVVTPKKQALIKTVGGSPNYMKSTSSSEAKESSQVSSWNSDRKSLCRRNSTTSKLSSVSSNKSARTLAKTSSFKLVRSLTKIPSFKQGRPLAKKCSRVVLCANMNAQRATCSSTLKDSKFPPWLMLNPGGTESEGTSVMKVCPYTFCSLNGNHHTPVQPLKCFLSARRRSLKIQRIMKLEAVSPRKEKPFGDGTEEIGIEQVVSDEKPALSPWGVGNMDFFIEIYAKNKGDDAEANKGSTPRDLESTAESVENKFSSGGTDEGALGEDGKQVSENISEGSPHSEIDFDETNSEMKNDAGNYSSPTLAGGVSATGSPRNSHDSEGECHSSIKTDDSFVMSMEWEEEQFSASEFDYEAQSPMEISGEFHFSIEGLLEESELSLDDSVNNPSKKILVDGVQQEGSAHTDNFSQVSCTLDYDQVSSAENVFDASTTTEEEEAKEDLIGIMTIPDSTKVQENEVIETDNMLPEAAKNNGATEDTDEALNKTDNIQLHSFVETEQDETNEDYNGIQKPEDYNLSPVEELPGAKDGAGMEKEVAEAEQFAGSQIFYSSQNFFGADEVDDEANNNQNNQKTEAGLVDDNVEESYSIQDTTDESYSIGSQGHLSDGQGQHVSTDVVKNTGFLEEGQYRTRECQLPSSMESDKEKNSRIHKRHLAEESRKPEKMEVEGNNGSDVAEIFGTANDISNQESERTISLTGSKTSQELPGTCNNRKWTIIYKRQHENSEEQRKFNPGEPNFLPLVPEQDAEKVDHRHQMMDERKNSEEWMLDYALRQAVTRLAPARKRKVALLVEAFETVTPAPLHTEDPLKLVADASCLDIRKASNSGG